MLSPQTISRSLVALLVAVFSLLAVLMVPEVASADEPPLRLSFINSAAKGGEAAHGTINDFLVASDDIAVTDAKEIWARAEELGLEEKDFRSSALREQNADLFRDLMKGLDIEALMVLDVFSRGRTAQIVVIGPSGREVADVREEGLRSGRVSKGQAKDMLKRSFAELVPAVRDFRDAGGWKTEEEEVVDENLDLLGDGAEAGEGAGEEEEADEALSLKEQVVAEKRDLSGLIDERFRLRVGALIGQRNLEMSGDAGAFNLGHQSPFLGFGGRLDGALANFGSSALGFRVFGGYAPFTTIFRGDVEYGSAFARIGAELRYLLPLAPTLRLDLFGGAEATSVTIEQNPSYTGHRYISGRAGAGVFFKAGPVDLHLGGGVLPVFATNNSDDAYGSTDFNLGYEANAGLEFAITEAIAASIDYTLHYYGPEYSEPVLEVGDGPIASSDLMHLGLISIGYAL